MIKLYKIVFIWFVFLIPIYSQSGNSSEAFKKHGFSKRTQLIKPKYPSYSLAATYILTEKAKKGDPFAQHELGIRYILGVGVPLDTIKAAYWIGQAASKKLPAANFNFGIMLNSGIGIEWNPFAAFKNFMIAAESGMEQAQYIIGLMYTDNLIVNKNISEAEKWLSKSAERGFEESRKVLKEFVKRGLVNSRDTLNIDLADKYSPTLPNDYSPLISSEYELDFYSFNEDSLTETDEKILLNEILSTDHQELKKKFRIDVTSDENIIKDTTAVGIIEFASNSGSPEALLIKARLLEYGVGQKINLVLSASNYLKAFRLGSYKAAESLLRISQKKDFYNKLESEVKKNNPEAMYVWAGLIALGLDYSLTEQQAFELLKKAKKENHINSIIELGLAYLSGSLVKQDSLKAIEYLKEASKLGSSEAKIRIALLDIKSKPEYIDSTNINILRKYSNEGAVLAQAALAYCYERGLSVKLDKGKAARLYRESAQRGNEAAFNSLRNMYDEIRPEEEQFRIGI